MIEMYQYSHQYQQQSEPYVSLADMILLGATITKPAPYDLDHCALGMAANAVGIPKADPFIESYTYTPDGIVINRHRFDQLRDRWPWLTNMRTGGNLYDSFAPDSNWNWIADTFNSKVCPAAGEPTMTLEELCAEVRRMEAAYIPKQEISPIDTAPEVTKIVDEELTLTLIA